MDFSSTIVERIAEQAHARPEQVKSAITLLNAGSTIPFIARYRKDVTDRLDEVKLETIADLNHFFIALEQRRAAILQNIEKQGKLTDELRKAIETCMDKHVLEDLYLPFKKKRKTKATAARDVGLEPLADFLWAQDSTAAPIEERAQEFVDPSKAVATLELALEGARHILAERISEDSQVRGALRDKMLAEGKVVSHSTKLSEGKKTKFNMYYDFTEPLSKIPSHRFLAIVRGTKEGLLRMDVVFDEEAALSEIKGRFLKETGSQYEPHISGAVEDGYNRLLRPSIENEVLSTVHQRADEHAIAVFRENARNLLLAPPVGRLSVLGLDPGLRTGCKVAAIDNTGSFKEHATIFPVGSAEQLEEAKRVLLDLIEKHAIEAIAIGNGTGSRETSSFVRGILKDREGNVPICVLVNEAGASVYSASKLAREEFPDLDVTIRGAVSIARRLQDPLAELVKLEPRSIGVGQYQHDVNQKMLREGLHQSIVSSVNKVGVELNTASVPLLRYISGIQYGTAQNIVTFRTEKGGFTSRQQLLDVPGVGPKVFEQCAGFLRISDAENLLDSTAIHPEMYETVEKIAQSLSTSAGELVRNRELLEELDLEQFKTDTIGEFSLADIRRELLRPGRDPRKKFRAPKFLEGVQEIADLESGMELEGVITNVTDFGAFVDVGVHQDGLVHLSQLANRYIRDPREVVHVGEVVKVKVMEIDKELPRISLSIRALQPAQKRTHGPRKRKPSEEGDAPQRPRRTKPQEEGARTNRTERKKSGQKPRGRSDRRDGAKKKKNAPPKTHQSGDQSLMNTQLADQLEALRDKLGT